MKTDTLDLRNMDCMDLMASMPDNSVNAIITDPPYFKVLNEQWDRSWDSPEKFIQWLSEHVEQWHRLLVPNGSLYCFASPKMAARVEQCIAKKFNILNHITWKKTDNSRYAQHDKDLRKFVDMSERIIFAEHYNSDNIAKGEAGYTAKCNELRGFVFEPLRAYLDDQREKSGFTVRQIAESFQKKTGSRTVTGMAGHWFNYSQWGLPTEENYNWLRKLLNKTGSKYLRREYEDLRREYEDLRRPFFCRQNNKHTDVWEFTNPNDGSLHPCEKPQSILFHIVQTSTRPGDVVFDGFGGSFSCALACHHLGRKFIGSELDPDYYAAACERVERETQQLTLITA